MRISDWSSDVCSSDLLVDADLRKPSVTGALGIIDNAGLAGILNGNIADMDDVILRDVIPNLAILPAGGTPGQPHELLASARFRQMVRETMREYDLTLYDTSAANQSPDALAVANAAGYAAIVSRRDHSYTRTEDHRGGKECVRTRRT